MSAAPITIPFGAAAITGTPAQLHALAAWLHQRALGADPRRGARVHLWDGQQVVGSYADLALLADRLAAFAPLGADPPARARYAANVRPAAYLGAGVAFAEPVTQTLNARGSTGGLRAPGPGDAQPANPAAPTISRTPQAYLAQVHRADLASAWGWTAEGPLYPIAAGHILIAAVRLACEQCLLLLADQMLAVRWQRSSDWDCYLPAALLNSWSVRVAPYLAGLRCPVERT